MKNNHIPILAIEEANYSSFSIIELIEIDVCVKIRIRFCGNDINLIQEQYNRIRELVSNPIVIINFPVYKILSNIERIIQFYEENIEK